MVNEVKTFRGYLDGLRRRKWQCLGVGALIVLVSSGVALGWPPTYRSTATILIEQQEIPEDLVRSTVTSYADQRIQVISQRVMTRANLLRIINKYKLYPGDMKDEPTEVVIDEMRDDIDLKMVSANVVDPRSGRPTEATIAFKLSYENRTPALAQKVANELTSLYLNENLKRRTELATETSDFMTGEADRLSNKITALEARLAGFKQRNADMLPDLKDMNLQLRDRAQNSLTDVDSRMRDLHQRIVALTSQLAQLSASDALDGEADTNPAARLKMLQTKLVGMSAVYAADYPKLVRIRKQVEALKNKVGESPDDAHDLRVQLESLQTQLKTDQAKYSGRHPQIKRLKKSIANVREALVKAQADPAPGGIDMTSLARDNPNYIQLKSRLDAAKAELDSLEGKKAELKEKIASYDKHLAKMPGVEQQYQALMRDYKNTVSHYRVIEAKRLEAQMAKALETQRKGERFTLIDPPQLPEQPVKPNRLAIGVLGMVFSLGGGVGTGVMLENMDTRIRGTRGVTRLGIPLLASVPYIDTGRERSRRRRLSAALVLGGLVLAAGLLALVHLLYMPLDVLWFSLMRRLGVGVH